MTDIPALCSLAGVWTEQTDAGIRIRAGRRQVLETLPLDSDQELVDRRLIVHCRSEIDFMSQGF